MTMMGDTEEVSVGLLVATASPNPWGYVLPTTVYMRSPGALMKATAAVHGTPKPPASATAALNAALESASDTVAGEKAESCATLSCCALFPIVERVALKLKAAVAAVVTATAPTAAAQSTGAEAPAGQHLSSGQATGDTAPAGQKDPAWHANLVEAVGQYEPAGHKEHSAILLRDEE